MTGGSVQISRRSSRRPRQPETHTSSLNVGPASQLPFSCLDWDKIDSSNHPLSGLWKPYGVKHVYYGDNAVGSRLLSLLPMPTSKAAIITGHSLMTKTPLIRELEQLLGPEYHAVTFSSIKEHSPVHDLKAAAQPVSQDRAIDTLISVGGGSPIDSAKWVSIKVRDMRSAQAPTEPGPDEGYLSHISIPTTLSAAECTPYSAYTNEDGAKVAVEDIHCFHLYTAILYDPHYASYTPTRLWLATGLRALDHTVELMYHTSTTKVPCKSMCMQSVATLFQYLPRAASSHRGQGSCESETSVKLLLAAFGSLGFLGHNMTSGLGLSHALGYALGAAYEIPHGETSCLALGSVVKLKAVGKPGDAEQIARLLPYATGKGSVWTTNQDKSHELMVRDALEVGDAVIALVDSLGLKMSLRDYGVAESEIDVIVTRALGAKVAGGVSGIDVEVFEQVKTLVKSL